jgi:outer membrane protein OmpA-like peptidoglycan-associated protein
MNVSTWVSRICPRLLLGAALICGSMTIGGIVRADDHDTVATVHVSDGAYQDLKDGRWDRARDGFVDALARHPDDPLVKLDLGLSYQKLGRMDLAEPLYRDAMISGTQLVPDVTTTDESRGLTVAVIACDNLKYGLQDSNACGPKLPPQPAIVNFIVFFDFNKSSLTAEAQAVVTEAASAAKKGAITHVTIVGHTDTVGSHSYNQALSERRADSVKSALVAQGIAPDGIAASGRSFDDPLVPTGPGVREPQNRRAVITLGNGPDA